MPGFATLPLPERQLLIQQVAARMDLVPVIVEKDFWVCWMLARIFENRDLAAQLVFKGGTSLSKVHGVIERFSEDIDLAVSPVSLGFDEVYLNEAPSASQRRKRMAELAKACEHRVMDVYQPALERATTAVLGKAQPGTTWLRYVRDSSAGTPNLLFLYPSALSLPGGYVIKQVKLEFGALTNQQPFGRHTITAMLATAIGGVLAHTYDDLGTDVVALELARTFWEKATILHAEFHRPAEQPIRDRFARHYADFAALWAHSSRDDALARVDLLSDVVQHKSRFFSSAWASYETARFGSFKLVPPSARANALAQDYEKMRPMFLGEPLTYKEIVDRLRAAEQRLNG